MASRITSSWVIPLAACFYLLLAAQPSGSIERSLSNSLGERFSEVRMFSTICSTIAISGCLWGFSGFQKRMCRDVYSSKDEQQVASEARPRSLYSTGKEGRRSKWEPWAPGDVWSSGVEKGAGRRVLWIITRPITSTIPPFSE